MTQQVFADRIGKSKSWVEKVERGVRKLDKISLIQHIANVLRINAAELLGADSLPIPDSEVDGIEGIRIALIRHNSLDAGIVDEEAPDFEEFRRQVSHAWLAYQHAEYPQLLRTLPKLLDLAQRPNTEHHVLGVDPVVQVYRITASVLLKVDEPNLALLATDRAATAAGGNPLLAAIAAISLAQTLRALGQYRLAMATSIAAAHRTTVAASDEDSADRLSVYGTLLLQAALAAARCGDTGSVGELVGQAHRVAVRVGDREDHRQTNFSPIAVEIAEVVATAGLGDVNDAIKLYEATVRREGWQRLPVEYRASYLMEIAEAYLSVGNPIAAGQALVEADRIAPPEIRYRPSARAVIAEVSKLCPPTSGVTKLATEVGLTR